MGAAGHDECDYWDDDDDDDESAWASDPEEEEGQAKEKMLQVAARVDEVKPSRVDEQRMVKTLGKRIPSWLAEMKPRIVKMPRGSRSQVGFYSCLLSAQDLRESSLNTF